MMTTNYYTNINLGIVNTFMKIYKLITIFLLTSFISSNTAAYSADIKNNSSKPLKALIIDNKAEYINKDWWSKFNDPVLTGYIVKAASANHDAKIASLKVQETQALVRESLGKEFPSLGVGAGFSIQKTSDIDMGPYFIPAYTQNNYLFPLTANYELDLWRKNREKTIGLGKELESAKYDEKSAYISLTASVATTYFNIIRTDKTIRLQKEIVDLRKKILDLTKEKNSEGLCSTFEVLQADKALTEAQTASNDLDKLQKIFLNQLAVLTGNSVDNAAQLKRSQIDDIDLIKDIPITIKSDVVRKRPDILKAEAQLQESKINVDLARKDFLPDFEITGQFGFNSDVLSKSFDWGSYIASGGVNLIQSIFSGGQKMAKLKAQKFRYEQMIENYQQTILKSFQEVNDSLIALKTSIQKDKDNISRVDNENKNLDLINAKYEQGAIAYLDTLQYKERVVSLEKEQIESKTDCLIDSLSLYKAVGGKL